MFALAAFVVGVFVCMRHSAVRVLVCVHRRVCILGVRVLMLRLVVVHVFVSVRYAVLMRVRMVMRFVCHVIRSRCQCSIAFALFNTEDLIATDSNCQH